MMKALLRLLFVAWFALGLPVFGIMPLVYIFFKLYLPHEIIWMWWAILRVFWALVLNDPEPGTEHIPPPFGVNGYWAMAVASFAISMLLIYCAKRKRASQTKSEIRQKQGSHSGMS